MNSLVIIAALTWVLVFALIVGFSRDKFKFGKYETVSEGIAVKKWKQGGRIGYYRIVIAFSGLITMGIAGAVKVLFY